MTPESTKDILYIPGDTIDFDELIGAIMNHFGVDSELSDFSIKNEVYSFGLTRFDENRIFIVTKRK